MSSTMSSTLSKAEESKLLLSVLLRHVEPSDDHWKSRLGVSFDEFLTFKTVKLPRSHAFST